VGSRTGNQPKKVKAEERKRQVVDGGCPAVDGYVQRGSVLESENDPYLTEEEWKAHRSKA